MRSSASSLARSFLLLVRSEGVVVMGGRGGSKTSFATRSVVSPLATLRLRSTLEFRLSVESTVSSVSTLFLLALLIIKELFEVVRDGDMSGESFVYVYVTNPLMKF